MTGNEEEDAGAARAALEQRAAELARSIRETHHIDPNPAGSERNNPRVDSTGSGTSANKDTRSKRSKTTKSSNDRSTKSGKTASSKQGARKGARVPGRKSASEDESVVSVSAASQADSEDEPVRPRRKKRKSVPIPKLKTSEILEQPEWPVGYAIWDPVKAEWNTSRLDAMTPEAAIAIRNLQMNREKEEKEFMPGRSGGTKDHPIKAVMFPEAFDDCRGLLHEARFLRQCLEHPEVWYNKVPIQRREIVRNIKLKIFGCDQQVAYSTIAALHNRGRKGIKISHFLPRNHNVEVCKSEHLKHLKCC